uniref:RNA helicase family protein n=1 Tax=Populus alba TaxID=43335 RepID=A0A4U5NKH8_POPAL|nr:RNA helicase family protein [Populus alba]
MATQVDESTVKLNPGVVGIAFAEQYYNTLSKSPELLHNFYNDSSLIGRPGLDGSVSSASTLEVSLLLGASSGVCCIFKSPSVELEFSPYLLVEPEMLNVGCYNWVNPGWLAIYLCIVRGSYSRIVGGVVSAGCLAASFFLDAALKQPEGTYRALASVQVVQIHPTSVLHRSKVECLIFDELVQTSQKYIRSTTRIDYLWLTELAPHYYAMQG